MALSKIQSESVNLADNFAFTGTVTGAGGGKVLQVVTSTTATQVINNTTNEAATGLSVAITPSSSSNKVFAIATIPIQRGSNSGNIEVEYYLKRGSTVINTGKSKINVNTIVQLQDEFSLSKLDSPSTTSATTYSVSFKETTQTNRYGSTMVCPDSTTATLTLMEISA